MQYIKLFTFIILVSFNLKVFAFDCNTISGDYYSVGDSDFQYHYTFHQDGKVNLDILLEYLDLNDNEKKEKETYTGNYKVEKNQFVINIEVREVNHIITFECKDQYQYMNSGLLDQALIPVKTKPEDHSFSSIPLFKKESKIIRRYF
jgi:hypothetical protein